MKPRIIIGTAVLSGLGVIGAVAIYCGVTGISPGVVTRDLRVTAEDEGILLPLLAGWMSMLSVMAWTAAGASAILAALMLPLRRRWLLMLAALLFALALDDGFMLHESVGPALGLSQYAFYLGYLVAGAWLLYYSVRHFSDGTTLALAVAGGMLALSVGVDLLAEDAYLLEDGFKLVGALVIVTVAPLSLLSAYPSLITRIPRNHQPGSAASTSQRSARIASESRSVHTSASRDGRE